MTAVLPPHQGALAGLRPRVLVSSDIGGTDADDFQSLVHLLVYADLIDLEGLVSSPWGEGRARHFHEVIDAYAQDHVHLARHAPTYPRPEALRALVKQGALEPACGAGHGEATEGSQWIVQCARRDDARPLHVLVWGGIDDLAQALHDAPDILPRLRVHFIGGPNKKWSAPAYHYLASQHPTLWCIESNATYRGWFTGGDQTGAWGNASFVQQHVAGHGALGRLFAAQLGGELKMGDTPSLARLLCGWPEDPGRPSWGGRFVRAWARPHARFERLTSAADSVEIFGVLELCLDPGTLGTEAPWATLEVENQLLPGEWAAGQGLRFLFCPREAKTYTYRLRSNLAALNALVGQIRVEPAPLYRMAQPSARWPNWWCDDLDPAMAEGDHVGARSVSVWRGQFLGDFARRMRRCDVPGA